MSTEPRKIETLAEAGDMLTFLDLAVLEVRCRSRRGGFPDLAPPATNEALGGTPILVQHMYMHDGQVLGMRVRFHLSEAERVTETDIGIFFQVPQGVEFSETCIHEIRRAYADPLALATSRPVSAAVGAIVGEGPSFGVDALQASPGGVRADLADGMFTPPSDEPEDGPEKIDEPNS